MFPDFCEKCGRQAVERQRLRYSGGVTFYRRCFACGEMLTYRRWSYGRWAAHGLKWGLILASIVGALWLFVVFAFILGGEQ